MCGADGHTPAPSQEVAVKRRSARTIGYAGTAFQVMLVGVLLLAVIWQLDGASRSAREWPEVAVSAPKPMGEPFVTTDEVNVRRGPGIDHEVISVLPAHADILVTGAGQHGFVPVEVHGIPAWISDAYVAPKNSVPGGTTRDMPVGQAEVLAPVEPDIEAGRGEAETEAISPEQAEPETRALVADVSAGEVAFAFEPETGSDSVEATSSSTMSIATTSTVTEPDAIVPDAPSGERWVDVNRTTGLVTLYEGGQIVHQFEGLIGKDPSPDGYYSTAVGTFYVHVKIGELTETPFAPGAYLSDFVGFDQERSNGFHSPIRDAEGSIIHTGGTTTLGCVRLGEDEAKIMYDFAFIGMRVEIHD